MTIEVKIQISGYDEYNDNYRTDNGSKKDIEGEKLSRGKKKDNKEFARFLAFEL